MGVISWGLVKNALAQWVESVTGLETHWAGQDQPRPDYPYVLLDVVSGPLAQHHDSQYVLADGEDIRVAVRGDREVTWSVEAVVSFDGRRHDHDADAHAVAEELRSSLERDQVREVLRAAGISVLDSRGAITNRRTALDAGFLSRAGFDLVTGLAASYVPATAEKAIGRVQAASSIAGRDSEDYYGTDGDPTPV